MNDFAILYNVDHTVTVLFMYCIFRNAICEVGGIYQLILFYFIDFILFYWVKVYRNMCPV